MCKIDYKIDYVSEVRRPLRRLLLREKAVAVAALGGHGLLLPALASILLSTLYSVPWGRKNVEHYNFELMARNAPLYI